MTILNIFLNKILVLENHNRGSHLQFVNNYNLANPAFFPTIPPQFSRKLLTAPQLAGSP